MRPEFRRPHGKVFASVRKALRSLGNPVKLISVGDPVTYNLIEAGRIPDMAVVDGMEERKPFTKEIVLPHPEVRARNPRGMITRELWDAVRENMGRKVKIFVEGEEDLAVLPCLLLAPEGSIILYGQPRQGVVLMEVTKEKKAEGWDLLRRMLEHGKG